MSEGSQVETRVHWVCIASWRLGLVGFFRLDICLSVKLVAPLAAKEGGKQLLTGHRLMRQ